MNLKVLVTSVAMLVFYGCSPSTTETLLICEGEAKSLVAGLGGKDRKTYEITKTGEKVTKVNPNIVHLHLKKLT